MMYNKVFGSDNNFYRLEIDYRQYKTVGRRKVIAWTVQSKNAFGDVPLTKYVLSGTPSIFAVTTWDSFATSPRMS